MRRVCVSIRVDVCVPGTPTDDGARRIASRHVVRWLNAGLPAPEPGVVTDLCGARMGHVRRR